MIPGPIFFEIIVSNCFGPEGICISFSMVIFFEFSFTLSRSCLIGNCPVVISLRILLTSCISCDASSGAQLKEMVCLLKEVGVEVELRETFTP